MRLRFTPSARAQFLAALTHIGRDDPRAARRMRDAAAEALSRLERSPDSGRRIPGFPDLPCREVVVAPYRFFYRVTEDGPWIVAVWHGAQLPGAP